MTIQVCNPAHGASKAALAKALNEAPSQVQFREPTPFEDKLFYANSVRAGTRFAVVMDPATRRRFATVVRKADGSWGVL